MTTPEERALPDSDFDCGCKVVSGGLLHGEHTRQAIREAVLEEREACAREAEAILSGVFYGPGEAAPHIQRAIAKRIRGRPPP